MTVCYHVLQVVRGYVDQHFDVRYHFKRDHVKQKSSEERVLHHHRTSSRHLYQSFVDKHIHKVKCKASHEELKDYEGQCLRRRNCK